MFQLNRNLDELEILKLQGNNIEKFEVLLLNNKNILKIKSSLFFLVDNNEN